MLSRPERNTRWRPIVLILLIVAVLSVFVLLRLAGADLRPEAVRDSLRALGAQGGVWAVVAPLVLIFALACILIVPVLPAIIFQVGSGLTFGPTWGLIYVLLADVLGAAIGFWLARRWGLRALRRWLQPATVERVEGLAQRLNWQGVILLRLLPGPAYPLVSFAAGLSPLRFRRYILASFAGVLPSLALLVFAGDVAADSWLLAAGIVVVFVASLAIAGRLIQRSSP